MNIVQDIILQLIQHVSLYGWVLVLLLSILFCVIIFGKSKQRVCRLAAHRRIRKLSRIGDKNQRWVQVHKGVTPRL